MITSARQGVQPANATAAGLKDNGVRKIRVRVDSGNREWHEELVRMLANHAGLEMLGDDANEIFRLERIVEDLPDVLLLTCCGNLDNDLTRIRKVRVAAPAVRIVMFGCAGAEREFLHYVRAGIRGYLLLGASPKDIWEVLEAVGACRESFVSELAVRIAVQLF
jgi:DNA-binding NarL/FixJ family response regulator